MFVSEQNNLTLAFPEENSNFDFQQKIHNLMNIYCEDSTKLKNYNHSPEIYQYIPRKKDESPNISRIVNEESFGVEQQSSPAKNAEGNGIVVMKFYNKQTDETIGKLLKGLQKVSSGKENIHLTSNKHNKQAKNHNIQMEQIFHSPHLTKKVEKRGETLALKTGKGVVNTIVKDKNEDYSRGKGIFNPVQRAKKIDKSILEYNQLVQSIIKRGLAKK